MSVEVRPASLQDGVSVLSLLEEVGYYPEPVSFAQTFRRTITNPSFLVRVAEAEDGRIVGVATLALRYQLGLGGLIANLDELAIAAYLRHLRQDPPVVVLTAYGLPDRAEAAARLGVDAFLHKPVSLVWLESLLRTRIDERRRGPEAESMAAAG